MCSIELLKIDLGKQIQQAVFATLEEILQLFLAIYTVYKDPDLFRKIYNLWKKHPI